MEQEGYLYLPGLLSKEDIQLAYDAIDGSQVHYSNMTHFIEDKMLAKINKELGWKGAEYIKFRVSDNNNSADAGAFHRDVIPQVYPKDKKPPCFTCLTYLDTTHMEIIPGTHLRTHMSLIEAFTKLKNVKRLTLNPGDVLVFYSTLIHRGIFTENLPHRRLIQVFDVFPDHETLVKYKPDIVHVLGKEQFSDILIKANKMVVTASILNFYGYLNAATGYGGIVKCSDPRMFLSSEGLRHRIDVVEDTWQPINKYIIHPEHKDAPILPEECYSSYKFTCFNYQFMKYTLVMVLLVLLVVYIIKNIWLYRRKYVTRYHSSP